jgi:hypothetical protein
MKQAFPSAWSNVIRRIPTLGDYLLVIGQEAVEMRLVHAECGIERDVGLEIIDLESGAARASVYLPVFLRRFSRDEAAVRQRSNSKSCFARSSWRFRRLFR